MGDGGALPTGDGGALPAGDLPSGDLPSGDLPSGDLPSGDLPSGDLPSGDLPSGDLPSGDVPMPDMPAGLGEEYMKWLHDVPPVPPAADADLPHPSFPDIGLIPDHSGDGTPGVPLPPFPPTPDGGGIPMPPIGAPLHLPIGGAGDGGGHIPLIIPPVPHAHKGGWWPSMHASPTHMPPLYLPGIGGNAWMGPMVPPLGCGLLCQAAFRDSACDCPKCPGSCYDIRMIALNYARHLLYLHCYHTFWYDRGHCLKAPSCCGCDCKKKIKCMDQCLCQASGQGGYVYNGGQGCEGDYTKSGALNSLLPAYKKGHVIYCGFACQKCNTHCFDQSDAGVGERMSRQMFHQGYDGTQDGCPPIWWYMTMHLAVAANYLPDAGSVKLPSVSVKFLVWWCVGGVVARGAEWWGVWYVYHLWER